MVQEFAGLPNVNIIFAKLPNDEISLQDTIYYLILK
jgi:hypothetical protein